MEMRLCERANQRRGIGVTNNLSKDLFTSIAPETDQLNTTIIRAFDQRTPWHELEPVALRKSIEEDPLFPASPKSANATERTIPGPAGDLTLRQFTPENPEAVFYHIHGGGWVTGSADGQDNRIEDLAMSCNLAVVSVEYRLAPEDPYPAAPDDCEAACAWLIEHGRAEYGSDRLLIGGESAGANLAVVTILRMRDKHGYQGFKAADLVFGCYDLHLTPSARNFGADPLIINTPLMEWFVGHYVNNGDLHDPDVSPMFADLGGLPPALFTVGTKDPLLDDSLFMYCRWLSAGNDAELAVFPGGAHGIDLFQIPLGRAAKSNRYEFLKSVL